MHMMRLTIDIGNASICSPAHLSNESLTTKGVDLQEGTDSGRSTNFFSQQDAFISTYKGSTSRIVTSILETLEKRLCFFSY